MGAPSKAEWSDLRDGDAVKAWNSLPASDCWDTVFSTTSFLEALATHADVEVEQITISDENGASAAARLAVRHWAGLAISPVPPFTAFSAIRVRNGPTESEIHQRSSSLENLLEAVERRFYAASIHLPTAVQDARVLTWRCWQVRPLYTYRIQLDAADEPLSGWSESARRIARQESEEFEICETDPESQARLVVGSYARNDRKPPLDAAAIESTLRPLVDAGTASIVAARNRESGEIDAAITILHHRSAAYYWLAGGRHGAAMTVLLASVLPDLASKGVEVFDFVGANTASIAEFKRKFGGQLTTYFRATWQRGIAGRLLSRRV